MIRTFIKQNRNLLPYPIRPSGDLFEFTVKAHRPKTNAADVKSEVVPIKASVTVKFGAGKENPTPYNGAETHCVSTNTLPAKIKSV